MTTLHDPDQLWSSIKDLYVPDESVATRTDIPISMRRRRNYSMQAEDPRSKVELIRDNDGMLHWIYNPPATAARMGRRAYRSQHFTAGSPVMQFQFRDLGPNDITQALVKLDKKLTPDQGMKKWDGDKLQILSQPPSISEKTLLFIHGTFSKCSMFFSELQADPTGADALKTWERQYHGNILAFDHPTLSIGAWSNAITLAEKLKHVTGPIDIICHSRGGLVASWLLRLRSVNVRRVIFVGSPMVGTSLASPDRLRAAIDMLANFADVVARTTGALSMAVPFAAGAAGLAHIFGKVLQLGSGLPITDAAVALVPGLATQQRTSNNLEIEQLFADDWLSNPQAFGIGAAFRPDEIDIPMWKLWSRFSNLGDQLKYYGADMIFNGANDLVVDVASMSGHSKVPIQFMNLGEQAAIHHCNYFRQPQVIDYLRSTLA